MAFEKKVHRRLSILPVAAVIPFAFSCSLSSAAQAPQAVSTSTESGPDSSVSEPVAPTPHTTTTKQKPAFRKRHPLGLALRVGTDGYGADMAMPISPKFALRVGGDFFHFGHNFQEEGANIYAALKLTNVRAQLDYFPFGGNFHISSLLMVANSSRARANVLVPPGEEIDLGGSTYLASATDPLHGYGRVDFNRVAPGLTVGFGNLTRGKGHWSVPTEFGFYYVGQPKLQVGFTGSACDPGQPASIGCGSVDNDADFQRDLQRFIDRNNHNLTYARFLPIINVGVGYRF